MAHAEMAHAGSGETQLFSSCRSDSVRSVVGIPIDPELELNECCGNQEKKNTHGAPLARMADDDHEDDDKPVSEMASRQARTLIGLIVVDGFVSSVLASCSSPFLPQMLEERHYSSAVVGLILGMDALSNFAFSPFCPWLCQRFGRRRVYIAALMTETAAALCIGWLTFSFEPRNHRHARAHRGNEKIVPLFLAFFSMTGAATAATCALPATQHK